MSDEREDERLARIDCGWRYDGHGPPPVVTEGRSEGARLTDAELAERARFCADDLAEAQIRTDDSFLAGVLSGASDVLHDAASRLASLSSSPTEGGLSENDREIQEAGFHGYVGCSHGDCPSPFRCSERGDCPAPSPAPEDQRDTEADKRWGPGMWVDHPGCYTDGFGNVHGARHHRDYHSRLAAPSPAPEDGLRDAYEIARATLDEMATVEGREDLRPFVSDALHRIDAALTSTPLRPEEPCNG